MKRITLLLAIAILVASIATSTASAAPPRAMVLTGPRATTASTSANFTFVVLNRRLNQLTSVECLLDGVSRPCTSLWSPRWLQLTFGSAAYAGLLPGRHTFTVRLTAPLGVVTNVSRSWTILGAAPTPQPAAPTVSIVSAPPSSTSDTTATFEFVLGGGPATLGCDLDGAPVPCFPATYSGLAPGPHTFTVTAANSSGSASDSRAWTITGNSE
jgi:hypothetical protein